jgi:hypothetical protein
MSLVRISWANVLPHHSCFKFTGISLRCGTFYVTVGGHFHLHNIYVTKGKFTSIYPNDVMILWRLRHRYFVVHWSSCVVSNCRCCCLELNYMRNCHVKECHRTVLRLFHYEVFRKRFLKDRNSPLIMNWGSVHCGKHRLILTGSTFSDWQEDLHAGSYKFAAILFKFVLQSNYVGCGWREE